MIATEQLYGIIGFEQLRIRCLIGADPHEKVKEQEIFVDLRVENDWNHCLSTGSLKDAVDYVKVAEICNAIAQSQHHELLETYAHKVTVQLFKEFPIRHIWIRVSKPHVLPVAKDAYVEFQARRP